VQGLRVIAAWLAPVAASDVSQALRETIASA
jgi:hypothetical protein